MLVKDYMSPNPITATPETTHKQATEIMRERNIHHLPVVDKNGKLVGIVVEADLLAAQPSPATTLSIYEIHGLLSRLQIKELMQSPVHTTSPECPLEEAAELMLREGIGCLPVMKEGQLVGIITDTDIFRALVALLGGGQAGARFTLHTPDEPGALAQVARTVAEAGGNIVSVTAWRDKTEDRAYITIKERGADFEALKTSLENLQGVEIVDMRQDPSCGR